MNLTFNKKDSFKTITIWHFTCNEIPTPLMWIDNQDGEGGAFDAKEVENVIYEALDKYFRENF